MNLLGIPMAPLDKVVRGVQRVLARDPILSATLAGGIYRYAAYFPRATGVAGRLIVAPLQLTLASAFSGAWTGKLDVAVIYEFTVAAEALGIEDDEPGAISLLSYVRDLLARVGPNLAEVEGDPKTRLKCIRNSPTFDSMILTPQPVEGSGQIGFFLALIAHYDTIEDVP